MVTLPAFGGQICIPASFPPDGSRLARSSFAETVLTNSWPWVKGWSRSRVTAFPSRRIWPWQ